MSSRELFKRFTNLCQKWPKDESKTGRDYGEYFRAQLSSYFPQGELSEIKDARNLERSLSALERLSDNRYYNENTLKRSSATGLEGWACKEAISNEGLKSLQEPDEGSLLERLRNNLSSKFLSSGSDYKFIDEVDLKDEDKSDTKK